MIPQFQPQVFMPEERPANDLWIWYLGFFTPSKGWDDKALARAHLYKLISHLLGSSRQTLRPQWTKLCRARGSTLEVISVISVWGNPWPTRTLWFSFSSRSLPESCWLGPGKRKFPFMPLRRCHLLSRKAGPTLEGGEKLKRSQGANCGPCFRAGSRYPCSWAGTSPSIFRAWERYYLLPTAWT